MPRQSRGPAPRAPSRPAAPPPRPAPQQTRPASTAAHPPAAQQAPGAQQQAQGRQSPGLFGQMASTAAGVAVGSSIGHALGGFFGGGSQAAAPADQPLEQQGAADQYAMTQGQGYGAQQVCQAQVANFKQCMDQNEGSLTICGWYLDQLKACQQAASQY